MDTVVVNGPEDDALDWHAVDWRAVEDNVRRLRQRIFTASQAGDLKKVRNLQKLMLRSRSNALLSVRRVTEVNAGRKTAGVDGRVVLGGWEKAEMAIWLQQDTAAWRPRPVKRVFIPKAHGKRRGLGIPVIADRALQALTVSALEPEWEARFESRSYGFRPGRSCQDAMQAIFVTARGKTCKRQWTLDADLAAAFDQIDHSHLLGQLGSFPARGVIAAWLKAGVIDQGRFAPTERGSPQGGVISPVLMNEALHGMEEAAGVRYITTGSNAGTARPGSPVVIRYADDVLALCHSREQAEQDKTRLAVWLAPRGLVFNEDKTRIVHLDNGVDFLGFNVRRYRGKLLIKPSKAAVKRIRERLTAEMRALRGHNAQMVLIRLNPIIRGWSAYYRHCVSARVFNQVDNHMWKLTYKWAKWTHPHKGKRWIVSRYFGAFNSTRRDRWVFGDRDSGAYLLKLAWTKITRHTLVKGWASPDDPAMSSYWAARRRRGKPPLDPPRLRLLQKQRGRCPLCGELLLHADQEPRHPDEWEQWITAIRAATHHQAIVLDAEPGTNSGPAVFRLIHTHCRRRLPDGTSGGPALPQP
ncbi:group II intron reverse transcriptase/maturase [Planotetraspora sp. A-T 1434]|uniref:group II intron reverse transcriptase/maturase n=1 Tax=Planotetraspora sp. A-T 1434 TaxID=2979219 RepID=UPI0021BEC3A3|nr:group II intron reverse transcriptase/maturase [Planotetraspora sp. A-T 1434]MCT9934971.1 group II intron reverse transcriptase/maturase [Planotetraspora sp. A-T 1434]